MWYPLAADHLPPFAIIKLTYIVCLCLCLCVCVPVCVCLCVCLSVCMEMHREEDV